MANEIRKPHHQMKPSELIKAAYSPKHFRESGHRLIDFLADRLGESLDGKAEKTIEFKPPEQAYSELTLDCPEQLFENIYENCIHLHDPRFMGHQIMPPVPIAALAGLMNDYVNNGMGVYEMGIAGTTIERWIVKNVGEKIGLGADCDGIMTRGGSLANLTAMLAARSHLSPNQDWTQGTSGQLALMVSDQSHYCVDRAAKIMGWGEQGIIKIATDDRFKMKTEELQKEFDKAKANGIEPIAVIGSACSTSTGSFDDLRAIGAFCQQNRLWFHVDGAHGAANGLSKQHRKLLDGIELADSVTIDFHKMLMTPAVASALIFRDAKKSYGSFAQQADYLWTENDTPQWYNLARRTFECTKSMLGMKVFSIVATHGWQIFEDNVDQLNRLAHCLAEKIECSDDFELATNPETNIVCFRFNNHDELDLQECNKLNSYLRKQLLLEGEFYIVQTVLNGASYLRCTISNPFSTPELFDTLLAKLRSFAKSSIQNGAETNG